jgi:sugar phosphate isomerase/epimerase
MDLDHPDPAELEKIRSRYFWHIRAASLMGVSVVGTETGCPNAAYKTDEHTHGEEALNTFIRNLAPVVETAERFGVCVAIEPVWKHIVYNADRAEQVLKAIGSKNLRIIFDPVNLLCPENLDRREQIFGEMIDKLADRIDVVHIKDYIPANGDLKSVAACTGEMDYTTILRFIKQRKPWLQATLENTTNDNAVWSREQIQNLFDSI